MICSIIGEHIDYALFGVLPAAIENDLIIAIARNESPAVTIGNVESKYTTASFEAESNAGVWDIPIDADLHWSGYVKAGYLVRAHSQTTQRRLPSSPPRVFWSASLPRVEKRGLMASMLTYRVRFHQGLG